MKSSIFKYIEENDMIRTADRVVAGVSGGTDSMCLLFLLWEYQRLRGDFQLIALHVHHGIRGETADRDAAFVEEFCRKRDIPFRLVRARVPDIARERHLTEEEAGRLVRYEAFYQESRTSEGRSIIAVAHHENDQAETVLHNLVRGSGIRGLTGMRPVQEYRGALLVRPLLECSRRQIEDFLLEQGIGHVQDESNESLDYTRNRIRRSVLPELLKINDRAVEHIAEAAKRLAAAEEYIQQQAEEAFKKYSGSDERGYLLLDCRVKEEAPVILTQVIRLSILQTLGRLKDIGAEHIDMVQHLLDQPSGRSVTLPYGLLVSRNYGKLVFMPENAGDQKSTLVLQCRIFTAEEKGLEYPQNNYTKWLDYDKIADDVVLRGKRSGDYIITGAGTQKLTDFLKKQKVPLRDRETVQVVTGRSSSEVLWVLAGDISRINERCKLTKDTRHILELEIKETENV